MLQRREWRLPGPSCADDRGRRPFVAPDAYPPQVDQADTGIPSERGERDPLPTEALGLPGLGDEFAAILERGLLSLDLSLTTAFAGSRSRIAYERFLLDLIEGDQTLFVSRDEVEGQ